ncbi:MAG: glycosyltransferase family 61 protein, partial [Cyanobacteria bacterium P01_H01_bin.152]
RCVQQEEELIAVLHNLLGERLVVFTGQQPLSEQIDIFRQAGLVIGPHGAGLTNILYCRPGTRVVEFPVVPMRLNQFAHLAAALDLEYWIVPTVTTHYQGTYTLDSYNLKDVINLVKQLAG